MRVLGHAPRTLTHRVHVVLPPMRRCLTPLYLADAVVCMLRRSVRSVRHWAAGTLGSFSVILALVVFESVPVVVMTWLLLVVHLARYHPSPRGMTGGAPSAARAAARPAAVAAATGIAAGAPGTDCTGTQSSQWTTADFGRWLLPSARGTPTVPRPTRRLPLSTPTIPRRCGARLPALLAAVVTCLPASAEASPQIGGGGGRQWKGKEMKEQKEGLRSTQEMKPQGKEPYYTWTGGRGKQGAEGEREEAVGVADCYGTPSSAATSTASDMGLRSSGNVGAAGFVLVSGFAPASTLRKAAKRNVVGAAELLAIPGSAAAPTSLLQAKEESTCGSRVDVTDSVLLSISAQTPTRLLTSVWSLAWRPTARGSIGAPCVASLITPVTLWNATHDEPRGVEGRLWMGEGRPGARPNGRMRTSMLRARTRHAGGYARRTTIHIVVFVYVTRRVVSTLTLTSPMPPLEIATIIPLAVMMGALTAVPPSHFISQAALRGRLIASVPAASGSDGGAQEQTGAATRMPTTGEALGWIGTGINIET